MNKKNPERIEMVLALIFKLWKLYPQLRLMQLIGNCFDPGDLFHVEDEELEKKLKETYEDINSRR